MPTFILGVLGCFFSFLNFVILSLINTIKTNIITGNYLIVSLLSLGLIGILYGLISKIRRRI